MTDRTELLAVQWDGQPVHLWRHHNYWQINRLFDSLCVFQGNLRNFHSGSCLDDFLKSSAQKQVYSAKQIWTCACMRVRIPSHSWWCTPHGALYSSHTRFSILHVWVHFRGNCVVEDGHVFTNIRGAVLTELSISHERSVHRVHCSSQHRGSKTNRPWPASSASNPDTARTRLQSCFIMQGSWEGSVASLLPVKHLRDAVDNTRQWNLLKRL